ncbi:sulfotransferase family protein [Salinicola corii]|uniref:Sulfotransferase family protein n=1 Tax=Salinicola corii TaxID=2606937 RepID=A0A640WGE4_9GAMM|nr:sulfotransferase family 2 domain-containing protein [Salinicola corii]KAA0019348.1 sulfotransferase family protein [Salinicola corii]
MFQYGRAVVAKTGLKGYVQPIYRSIVPLLVRDRLARERVNPYSDLENMHNVIFVHIPKNAGNGVAKSLFEMTPKGHNYLSQYLSADPEKYASSFKFAFSRNVWSRFYSAYAYLKNGGFGVYDQEFFEKYLRRYSAFEDFVHALEDDALAAKIMSWTHFVPQSKFILVNGMNDLDFLGSVENLSEGVEIIQERLGLPKRNITRVNSSGGDDYRRMYDSKSVDIVARLYAEDAKLLGSVFEN